MSPLEECCGTCRGCGLVVCLDGWPANYCTHGQAVCKDCAPGGCEDCAAEMSRVSVA